MSKRKLATSYSSLRRQVKAQVHDDMHFIAHDSMSSDSGDACSNADAPCCVDNGECIEPNDIASENDENDVDVSHSVSNVMSDAHLQHGDFADYCRVDSSMMIPVMSVSALCRQRCHHVKLLRHFKIRHVVQKACVVADIASPCSLV